MGTEYQPKHGDVLQMEIKRQDEYTHYKALYKCPALILMLKSTEWTTTENVNFNFRFTSPLQDNSR